MGVEEKRDVMRWGGVEGMRNAITLITPLPTTLIITTLALTESSRVSGCGRRPCGGACTCVCVYVCVCVCVCVVIMIQERMRLREFKTE